MLEKTMNARKKIILLRSFCVVMLMALLLSPVALMVSAADVNGNEFFNPLDYGKVNYNDNSVSYEISTPASWYHTVVFESPDWSRVVTEFWGSSVKLDLVEFGDDKFSLRMHPFSDGCGTGWVGKQVKNAHILDFDYIPHDSVFSSGFTINIDGENFSGAYSNIDAILYFVDSNGIVVSSQVCYNTHNIWNEHTDHFELNYTFEFDLSTIDIPDNVVGFLPLYTMRNVSINDDYPISIKYSPFCFDFSMSALEYQAHENEKLQKTMKSVQDSLLDQNNKLDGIQDSMQDQNNKLDGIQDSMQDQNNKLDGIQDSMQDQNDKLDKLPGQIGDEMQGVIDQGNQQAQGEGNKFVDQILDKLPDPSQGILSALGNLTSAVNYTGTDAALTIPAIVLPGIGDLFPETEIWGGTEFSFGEYVRMLPPGLLLLVQSLFTIAMVLFCVFELKGIISYCFTLREKDGG